MDLRFAAIVRRSLICAAVAGCAAMPPAPPYRYAPPPVTADGWSSDTLEAVGIAEAPMTAMVNAIRADEYENIHSVLLVRDGRLVLEGTSTATIGTACTSCTR